MINNVTSTFKSQAVRLLFYTDFSYFMGYWICYINMSWLVYTLTQSSFSLGMLGFMINIPFLFIMPFGGVLADSFDKRKVLMLAELLLVIPTLILIGLSYTDKMSYVALLIMGFFYGAFMALGRPAGYAYVKDIMEDKRQLHNAIGVFQTNSRSSQFIASGLNGILHLTFSFATAFISALVFNLIAIVSLLRIKKPAAKPLHIKHRPLHSLAEGFRYVFRYKPFWATLLLAVAGNATISAYISQLPVFAAKSLDGGIHTLSFLFLAGGIGGVLGGIYLASRKQSHGLMKLTSSAGIVAGLSVMLFSQSTNIDLSLITAFIIDFCYIIVIAGSNAALQIISADEKRGRVMGIFGMLAIGLSPASYLIFGSLAHLSGAPKAIFIVGCICSLASLWYLLSIANLRTLLQPIYSYKELSTFDRPI